MTTINDLPDEPKYPVKRISDLTGINPVTLRAWERRYGILNPDRDENQYRLYSDRDLAILRWLINQKNKGTSISNAATKLQSMIDADKWPEIIPFEISLANSNSLVPAEPYADKLFQFLSKHNELEAGKLFVELTSKFDLETLITDIFTPTLVRIGESWFRGDILISTEHFASAFIFSRLSTLFISLPLIDSGPGILIGGAPGEEHEIGPLMMALLLRQRGYRVEFLGANLHLDDLVDYASIIKPALVILTASTTRAVMELLRAEEKFNTLTSPPIFCYAGLAFEADPSLVQKIPGTYLGGAMVKALDIIKGMLTAR